MNTQWNKLSYFIQEIMLISFTDQDLHTLGNEWNPLVQSFGDCSQITCNMLITWMFPHFFQVL